MNFDYLYRKRSIDEAKLLEFGFVLNDGIYEYKVILNDEFYLKVFIDSDSINTKVYESDFDDEYLPFLKIVNQTSTARSLQEQVEAIVRDIVNKCFVSDDLSVKILKYVNEKYGTVTESPWEENPEYFTLNTKYSNKWYGLIMRVNSKVLGIDSNEIVDIINIKVDSNIIDDLVDNKLFFNAYHMNKKNWITILLDKKIDLDLLFSLIDKSYELVEKKRNTKWIVPVAAKWFDIEEYFSLGSIVDWKQSAKICDGDIIYMYISAPYSKILYKCVAVETNLEWIYGSKSNRLNYMMRIKVLEKYDKEPISLALMKNFGVTTVRGPRNIPDDLVNYINRFY